MTVLDDLRDSGGVARLAEYLLPNGHPEQGGTVWRAGGSEGDQGRSLTCALDGPNAGTYHDHATGDSGSLIQLLQNHERLDTVGEARDWLIQNGYISRAVADRDKKPKEQFGGPIAEAAPPNAKPPNNKARDQEGNLVAASAHWRYETADGRVAFYVMRYDFADGSKSVLPRSWGTRQSNTGKALTGWQGKSYPVPRPLYHLPELIERSDAPIVVTEGEKAADAAKRLLPATVATTSSGGSKAAKQTNWIPAATPDRNVYLLPDFDDAGEKYIAHVASLLARGDARRQGLPRRSEAPRPAVRRHQHRAPAGISRTFPICAARSTWVPCNQSRRAYEPPKELVPKRSQLEARGRRRPQSRRRDGSGVLALRPAHLR